MAITNAVERGTFVYVYGDKGKQLFVKPGQLHGFTSASIVVRKGGWLYTYDEKGRQIATTSAR